MVDRFPLTYPHHAGMQSVSLSKKTLTICELPLDKHNSICKIETYNKQHSLKETTMKFNEICQAADLDRDQVYGLRVGSDRFGYDAVAFSGDIVSTVQEPTESPYQRGKREKRENIAVYRAAFETTGKFSYDDAVNRDELALHRNQLNFVAAGIKSGMIEEITEDDLLDA